MFRCENCNYSTNVKCNFNKHLKTKKHIKTCEINDVISLVKKKGIKNDPKRAQMSTKYKLGTQSEHKHSTKNLLFECDHCKATFSSKPILKRHQNRYCKKVKSDSSLVTKLIEEKKELYGKIEALLEENGKIINTINTSSKGNTIYNVNNINTDNSTNIQQTNNIVIRNYGNEDLSHLTKNMMDQLISAPGDMIKNLTRLIHFNIDKPENMNMYIPSKKQKHMKTFKNNKWVLEPKMTLIEDIVDRNYLILDSHFEGSDAGSRISQENKKYYENYQKLMDQKNSKLLKSVRDECEYIILNNSDKVKDKHGLKY